MEEDTADELETRYYIGLMGGTRFSLKAGPGRPRQFGHDRYEPVLLDEMWTYPVSAEIATEWHRDDEMEH